MNKVDFDVLIFVTIFLFLINTYIYLFFPKKELFWKRVSRGLKKVGNVVGKYTGVTYIAEKTGLAKQVNKKKCRNERERARRDMDNEYKYLSNTKSVKNSIINANKKINDTDPNNTDHLNHKSTTLNTDLSAKNEKILDTIFQQQSEDSVSKSILNNLYTEYENKYEDMQELL